MPQNIARHSLDVFQHYTLQDLDPNEVSLALLLVLAVQRTIKEVLCGIAVVGRAIEHLRTAVGTVDKPRKDAASACAGHSVPLLPDFLHLLKHSVLNDTLMGVWKDGLFLDGRLPLFFVPDGVGIGLEVHRTARVLPPFQNVDNTAVLPSIRIFWFLIWTLYSLQCFICGGGQHLVRFQLVGDRLS